MKSNLLRRDAHIYGGDPSPEASHVALPGFAPRPGGTDDILDELGYFLDEAVLDNLPDIEDDDFGVSEPIPGLTQLISYA